MNESCFTQADWESLVVACKECDIAAHLAVAFAAKMPTPPPAGPTTRDILAVWAGSSNDTGGGPSRLSRNESFLSRVCGRERATQFAVFLDLAEHAPADAKAVFERIHALAANAAEEVPNIGRMAMPVEAKQMYQNMCRFLMRLGETAKAAEDRNPYGVLDSGRPRPA